MKIKKFKNKLLQIYYKPVNTMSKKSNKNFFKEIENFLQKKLK